MLNINANSNGNSNQIYNKNVQVYVELIFEVAAFAFFVKFSLEMFIE